jgi:hypothetical protein
MRDRLIIIPCGKKKVWDNGVTKGPVPARSAYTGTMFKLGVKLAESMKADWIVLSAKYGFILPDHLIGPYDVTFKKKSSGPISNKELYSQVNYDHACLLGYGEIIGLGGTEYRKAIKDSFCMYKGNLTFPLAGLSMGYYLQYLKRAIEAGGFYMEGFYVKNGKPCDAGMFDDDI